mmetsp:Transcript_62084/g.128574  ORF Transcript_62084/g.128574 Transcript_62084/m.128574 type:complete len:211 (+) Transcript_62084:113-745(+)
MDLPSSCRTCLRTPISTSPSSSSKSIPGIAINSRFILMGRKNTPKLSTGMRGQTCSQLSIINLAGLKKSKASIFPRHTIPTRQSSGSGKPWTNRLGTKPGGLMMWLFRSPWLEVDPWKCTGQPSTARIWQTTACGAFRVWIWLFPVRSTIQVITLTIIQPNMTTNFWEAGPATTNHTAQEPAATTAAMDWKQESIAGVPVTLVFPATTEK